MSSLIIALDFLHNLFTLVLLDAHYSLHSLLLVSTLKVLNFLPIAEFLILALLNSHQLVVLFLSLVIYGFLALFFHFDHGHPHVLSILLLLKLFLVLLFPQLFSLQVKLTLSFLSYRLASKELLLSLLLKLLILEFDHLNLALLLGSLSLNIQTFLLSPHLKLLTLLFSLAFTLLELLPLHLKELLLSLFHLFNLLVLLKSLDFGLQLLLLILFL